MGQLVRNHGRLLLAQSDSQQSVAGWTVRKIENGGLSACRPFDAGDMNFTQGLLGAHSRPPARVAI